MNPPFNSCTDTVRTATAGDTGIQVGIVAVGTLPTALTRAEIEVQSPEILVNHSAVTRHAVIDSPCDVANVPPVADGGPDDDPGFDTAYTRCVSSVAMGALTSPQLLETLTLDALATGTAVIDIELASLADNNFNCVYDSVVGCSPPDVPVDGTLIIGAAATATATSTSTPTHVAPTPTRTPGHPPGVGGTVKLPPAAIAAESGAPSEDSTWPVGTYAALAGGVAGVLALAAGGWYASRRRWLR
jgi:hypothetical protein